MNTPLPTLICPRCGKELDRLFAVKVADSEPIHRGCCRGWEYASQNPFHFPQLPEPFRRW